MKHKLASVIGLLVVALTVSSCGHFLPQHGHDVPGRRIPARGGARAARIVR